VPTLLRSAGRTAPGLSQDACYRRRVRWLLVLWDIDFTLINAGGVGTRLYRMVFRDMFGTDLPAAADMAGRTDRAIVLDTLARAGIPEPHQHLEEFLAKLAALAPTGHELAVQHSRALPGATAALDALAAGYKVYAVMDASGDPSEMTSRTTLARFIQAGVIPTSANAVLCELQRTWNRPDAAQFAQLYTMVAPNYGAVMESYGKAQEVARQQRAAPAEVAHSR